MGLKDRIKKLVSDTLRPWLLCEVFPIVHVTTSGLSLQLPQLDFNAEVLNSAVMESSPLIIKEAMKMENVEMVFSPFRQPVATIVVQGWHLVLQPRSTEDDWWQKKGEKTAEQRQAAALFALDPQGGNIHNAAMGLAQGKVSNSLKAQFLTSLILSSARLEFRDCSLTVVSHVDSGHQHFYRIALSSFEFGESHDIQGSTWSGGLLGAVTVASHRIWKKSRAHMAKYCIIKGLGLQVETHCVDSDSSETNNKEEMQQENTAAEVEEIAQQYFSDHSSSENREMTTTPEAPLRALDKYAVHLEDLVLGLRFRELEVDSLELDAPDAAFGLDFEELHALQILASQMQGPAQNSLASSSNGNEEIKRSNEREDDCLSGRSAVDLWKKGIQKAVEFSSHRRLTSVVQAGISRRQYSRLYESWLLEMGWGQRRDDEKLQRDKGKGQLGHLQKLSEDIFEAQKKLPLEAIALARRVARHRVSAALRSHGEVNIDEESVRNAYFSFQVYLGSFWQVIALPMTFMQSKTIGFSTWISSTQRLGASGWKSMFGLLKNFQRDTGRKDELAVAEDAAQSAPNLKSSSERRDRSNYPHCCPENYFHLGFEQEDESNLLFRANRGWTMTYALKIRRASLIFVCGEIRTGEQREETDSRSKEGKFEKLLVPAVHLSWEKTMLAYGSTVNATGLSLACGILKAELVSILPSHLPLQGSMNLDKGDFCCKFPYLGRWATNVSERASILSSCSCPEQSQTSQETLSELMVAGEMHKKHWIWQDQHLEAWDKTWQPPITTELASGSQSMTSTEHSDGNNKPFMMAELNRVDDEPGIGDCPGGLIKCSFALGQLNLALEGSLLLRIRLLLDQYLAFQTATKNIYDKTTTEHQSPSQPHISLEKLWEDTYEKYLDMCRTVMLSAIPEKSIFLSGVVEGPKIKLSSTASELCEYKQEGYKDKDWRQLEQPGSNIGATVVLDFGRIELVMWPPPKKEAATEVPKEVGSGSDAWTHAVESKVWLKRPPVPGFSKGFTERRFWEHEQVGNNLCICIEGVALIMEMHRETLKELPVMGPLAMVIEASVCWDQYSSLFSTSKSVSAAVGGKMSSLSLQTYIDDFSVVLKVLDFYMGALKAMSVQDSATVLGGDSISTEVLVQSSEGGMDFISKPDSCPPTGNEIPFSFCALSFSMEFEKLRLALGYSRQDDGHHPNSNSSTALPSQNRQGAGLRYEPMEEMIQTFHNDDWGQNTIAAEIGSEAYILIQDVLIHVSLGDGEQFCIFMGMKDALLQLVDSSVSTSSDLEEMRSHFSNVSVSDKRFALQLPGNRSLSDLVLTEVSLDYLSLRAFGPPPPSNVQEVTADEKYSSSHNTVETSDGTQHTVDLEREKSIKSDEIDETLEIPRLSSSSATNYKGFDQEANSCTSVVRSGSPKLITIAEQNGNGEQTPPVQYSNTGSSRDEKNFLVVHMELGKVLVTDGSLDGLVARVIPVATGAESLNMNLALRSNFQEISLDIQGGLVLVHTAAAATLVQFCVDFGQLVAKAASLVNDGSELNERTIRDVEPEVIVPSLSYANRSSSVPPLSTGKQKTNFKRTSSAPPTSQIQLPERATVISSPKFGGVLCSKVAGFSLVLARHNVVNSVPAEGVLFELEMAFTLDDHAAKKASFDLLRFTVLGLQARVSQNSQKNIRRAGSRTPQFGSSSKSYSGIDVPPLSIQQEKPKKPATEHPSSSDQITMAIEEGSETVDGGLLRSTTQTKHDPSKPSTSDVVSTLNDEIVDSKGTDKLQRLGSITNVAEGLPKEFNSFILECLSVHCTVSRVGLPDKVWKWSDAWQGQCSIIGLDVAITTSEIQLLESLVTPLSSLGGSSSSTAVEPAANPIVEGTKEHPDEGDFDIPDGSIIAIKDVREHCYLAAEEIPTNKGHYRLVGVLHYTLAGDKALFKVKYQNSSTRNSNSSWFSLLSLHAKQSDGESFRVHYRPGSGLADISTTKDGSWERWQFLPVKSLEEGNGAELDIQNPALKHLFHLVNQKSKNGIAFEENVPVMVPQPGNPFKVKIVAKPTKESVTQTEETPLPLPPLDDQEAVRLVTSIPHVVCKFDTFIITVLHEAAGGLHLLPLLRTKVPATEGVVQVGLSKSRTILQCSLVLEYYQTQTSLWVPIINPIETDVFYRARSINHTGHKKTPVALFSRFKRVEVVVSEPALDACLFLIGALDLAGPYTVRYSPVRANRCLVENHTGVDLVCCFDQGSSKLDGMISSGHSDPFLMRHMTSRRDSGSAKVASNLELYLQALGKGATTPLLLTLGDPGTIAIRTRLQTPEGRKTPGPMLVVDVSRRSQDGIFVTVSPMVRIRNASGLSLELRCRRDGQGEEGAVVVLEDGDTIDDSMGTFDALNFEGELKKALLSLNLGNYRLSIKPMGSAKSVDSEADYEWSEDVKGAKPLRADGIFDKLQYSFNKTAKARNLDSKFGVVFCPTKALSSTGSLHNGGLYFLIRTTCRQIPVSRPKTAKEQEQQGGRYAVVAWKQQQELLLLPTVRVLNLTTSSIAIKLDSSQKGRKYKSASESKKLQYDAIIKSGGKAPMYIDLVDLVLVIKHEDLGLVSHPLSLGVGNNQMFQNANRETLRDLEIEVNFGDGNHTALVTVSRGDDGVLEVVFLTRYSLQNDSHVTLLCCSSKDNASRWRGFRTSKDWEPEWPSSGIVMTIAPKSRISWFERSTKLLVKRTETDAQAAALDLESVSGSMEISLRVQGPDSVDNRIQLGVQLRGPPAGGSNPSCVIRLAPRYIVVNDSGEAILVCQDGFQEDSSAMLSLGPGERSALHAQVLPEQKDKKEEGKEVGPEVLLTVCFRPKETGWKWSGPVCAAALGSFSVKIRHTPQEEPNSSLPSFQTSQNEGLWFAVANVQEVSSSLIMTFRRQAANAIPYRIENALRSASITYNQKGLDDSEVLEARASVGYVWDDLGQSHTLTIKIAGTSLYNDVNPDKLRSWKSFRASRRKTPLLQLPFLNDLSNMAMYGDEDDDEDRPKESKLPPIGYEVYADGPTRVVRVCEERESRVDRRWQSDITSPKQEFEIRIPLFTMTLVEPSKQAVDAYQASDNEQEEGANSEAVEYVPVICLRLTNCLVDALITPEYTLCQIKSERLDVDVKWHGAPVAAMLRGSGQDRFAKGHTVLHMAVVISNLAKNPLQVKYASILLQAMDLNLDEDTLMKLAPFYRYSLSESTAPSRRIYFERFEIHPIKIVGSFLPGNPRADYSSVQETLRALLHSVIKVPTVRGTTVELNGVLLANALLTYKQLALKCAQHYSWYAMRAIYIARGSKLLPAGFASLFDDSAASSLDVFFDPSNGSVDLQGLTLGMFGMLSRGLRKTGKGGTHRYLGDLQHTVKAAGSNLLFAVVTEVSDSIIKGADASGLDGLVSGFRRGILNVAMKPSVLRGAVVQGGSTRRIKLDRIVGTDEAYIEGYLQAMLDALFKQNYLRVKVIDDQVVLKNLPPNTILMEEIVNCVRNFLIGEGLLAGESSAAAISSLRRLRGEDERRLGPTIVALCEQLLVIIVVRSLRRQTIKILHQNNISIVADDQNQQPDPPTEKADDHTKEEESHEGFFRGINVRRAVTSFALSSALAYADGRICRHIPNPLLRRIVSGFLLSFVE